MSDFTVAFSRKKNNFFSGEILFWSTEAAEEQQQSVRAAPRKPLQAMLSSVPDLKAERVHDHRFQLLLLSRLDHPHELGSVMYQLSSAAALLVCGRFTSYQKQISQENQIS